jgi:hypothetical protein
MKVFGEERGFFGKGKISARQLEKIKPYMNEAYRKLYGTLFSQRVFQCYAH